MTGAMQRSGEFFYPRFPDAKGNWEEYQLEVLPGHIIQTLEYIRDNGFTSARHLAEQFGIVESTMHTRLKRAYENWVHPVYPELEDSRSTAEKVQKAIEILDLYFIWCES